MTWIQSYGSKYHLVKFDGADFKWSWCGINLMKEPTEDPQEDKRCKKCVKLAKEAGRL
ncbi:hypothetical protein M0R72_19580 [Candidatus Pacearchaeota archaeon]|jgi:hypothetical protein|nr:hypothetical protein [Candidatus Pacearchaeota archaeon]